VFQISRKFPFLFQNPHQQNEDAAEGKFGLVNLNPFMSPVHCRLGVSKVVANDGVMAAEEADAGMNNLNKQKPKPYGGEFSFQREKCQP
jgi:hypothetical protein